jgi:hypothetical protein
MSLSRIVNVQITKNTSASNRAEFGVPLFITSTVPVGFTERVRVYSAPSELLDDLFTSSDPAYLAVQAIYSQNPVVTQVLVGRTDVGDSTYADTITAISEENDEWYAVTADTHVKADVLEIAATVEALNRMYFVSTQEVGSYATIVAATDTAAALFSGEYERTVCFYFDTADTTFPECSLVGHNLPYLAGAATWGNIQLGIGESKNASGFSLTETQVTNLQARKCNYAKTYAGITIVRNGVTSSGEWIDVVRGIDALEDDLQKTLFDLLINQQGGKIPYDDNGLNQVRGAITNVLRRFVNRRFLQENFTINIPAAADIQIVDKTNRILSDVSFEAFLVGAIHTIDPLSGNVSYEGT